MVSSVIGESVRRREDDRFLTGRGVYLDDLTFDKLCHGVFLRSPHPHAKINQIDFSLASARPDVLAVLTSAKIDEAGLKPLDPFITNNPDNGKPFSFIPQPILATGVVRFVGEPVVFLVAETIEGALDALETINVEYSVLPCITSAEESLATDTVKIAEQMDNNICLEWKKGDTETIQTVFEDASHVVDISLHNHRIVTNPIEPRGAIALWDGNECTIHASSQNIHVIRDTVAKMLNVETTAVRFIAPDVGGGFGSKNFSYPEYAAVAWASKLVGRPVKWIATRSEVFLGDHQGRDHSSESRLALDDAGKFLGLQIKSIANLGAYMVGSSGGVQVVQYANLPGTVYKVPKICLEIYGVLTNTTPIGVFRGPGYAETTFIMERLIDVAAQKCGFDRFELRRQNMIGSDEMPFTDVLKGEVDSGDFPVILDKVLEKSDFGGFQTRKQESKGKGLLRGFGLASYIKGTGGAPDENVDIHFLPDDTIYLITGTQTIGQGHETTFPQILANELGIEDSRIFLKQGDTRQIANGGGHGSSRSTYIGGTAIYKAAREIISKAINLSADILETAATDIFFEDGRFTVVGTDRSIGLLEVAKLARERDATLDTFHRWTREAMTFPNGTHVAEVEVDSQTGQVTLARYVVVDDYGILINPAIVRGQLHGAIAQGVGQALLEHAVYDKKSGQLMSASFMDYALPKADNFPEFDIEFHGIPCTTNPLGVKGCGEGGTVAAFPAVINAICDALSPFDVSHFNGPACASTVWKLMQKD
ncbi:MAG: carbon monoxide dehydrogenase [Rhodospirillaceae bacterium]|nr:carbon monoxide dehydrogenase [Rhodospirillaceae bacterium]|tara:strand:- start:225 stop:2516 length:2292 start_codon:yes stop_codon:yes gene_type:complete